MKALVWNGPSDLTLESVSEPVLSSGYALVHVTSASICGSDVSGYIGKMGNRTPGQIMGHEFAGVVQAVADSSDGHWAGQRVTVNPLVSCGTCEACISGMPQRCDTWALIGVQRPGGFAEAVAVPVANLLRLPDSHTETLASLVEPVAHGFHGARVATSGGTEGSMLVIGAGPVGLFAALAASQLGISRICVLERDRNRRSTAESLGLAAFELVDDVRAYLGVPDVIFDAVGSSATRSLAVELVRRGGRVVLDGLADPMGEFSFMQAILREVELHGSFGYAPDDFDSALAALEGDSFEISSHVKVIPFADGPAAFASMAGGDLNTLKTVLHVSEL